MNHNSTALEPSGFLLIDKPAGPSSAHLVAEAKRKLACLKVGHAGTLDPFATGLLILMVGPATRLARFAAGGLKRYSGVLRLGLATSSDDITGDVLLESAPPTEIEAVQRVVRKLSGEIDQVPPQISAVKVDGERAYRRSRNGEQLTLTARRVTVSRFELTPVTPSDYSFVIECSSGTYIRSLARDLGEALGCGGCIVSLRREVSLPFSVEDAVSPDQINSDHILPWTSIFPTNEIVRVAVREYDQLQNGLPRAVAQFAAQAGERTRLVYCSRDLPGGGVIELAEGGWKLALNLRGDEA